MRKKIVIMTMILGLLTLCFTGCQKQSSKGKSSDENDVAKDEESGITIKYIGNSCFKITFKDGTTIVSDPYPESMDSYFTEFPSDLSADVVTISHEHEDHTATTRLTIAKECLLLCQVKEGYKIGDVTITGYNSRHVADMCDNTIFIYEENGYKIVNLGETDTIPNQEVTDAIKDADVVLSYAGEYGTVKNEDLFTQLMNLNVNVIIPEHYSMNSNMQFFGEPTIDTILTEVPEQYSVENNNTDEMKVENSDTKKFVVLQKNK